MTMKQLVSFVTFMFIAWDVNVVYENLIMAFSRENVEIQTESLTAISFRKKGEGFMPYRNDTLYSFTVREQNVS